MPVSHKKTKFSWIQFRATVIFIMPFPVAKMGGPDSFYFQVTRLGGERVLCFRSAVFVENA